MLFAPCLQHGEQLIHCDAQKATFTACGEDVGDLAARVLYHFHNCKAQEGPVVGYDEQSCVSA